MTIHGLDDEGTPQHLSMSKKERTGTFAVRDGLNASGMVVYDYSKVRRQPRGRGRGPHGAGGGGRDRTELTQVCLQTAAGRLQVLAPPRLLHHPRGQGQHPGAGHRHRDFPAPAGEQGVSPAQPLHPGQLGQSEGLLGLRQASAGGEAAGGRGRQPPPPPRSLSCRLR